MSNIAEVKNQAELVFAAYANISDGLINAPELRRIGMAESHAQSFSEGQRL